MLQNFSYEPYTPDGEMAEFFRNVALHKCFHDIRKATHNIHEHIARNAVVIPLWQLDTYVALANCVREATLDPFVLFGNIQHWELKAGPAR